MSTTPIDEKKLLPEKRVRSRSLKQSCASEDCNSTVVPFISPTVEINAEKRKESVQSRPLIQASNRIPLAKTLAHKKLRKYASETCFSLEAKSPSDLSPKENDLKTAIGNNKIFSIQPVNITRGDTSLLRDGSVPSCSQHVKREDSEGEASGSGSDATLASMTMTPILQQKSRRTRLNRPKSSTLIYGTSVSSDAYNTPTSATLPSIDSLQQIGLGMIGSMEERRGSSFYNIDDDSLHEFDDEKESEYI
ncbi:unnamed protein product [Acanthocheilonema viteae]|uniref:Uncharacterized protein n=1 Tax=Acanthocheilonema viteae TaxID=6277 RepID=A0A498S560_ACAVI|nr:unnamed protein product [Acanthocheilonema viteae]